MKYSFFRLTFWAILAVAIISCKKEISIDTSTGSGGSGNGSSLVGNWKLLYMTSDGNEEGTYTEAGINNKDIYLYRDSTENTNGIFSFNKDSLTYGISYNQVGREWNYEYENGVLKYADSSDYNDPVADAGVLPYKVKGDSITLIDNTGAGMFDLGIPATYKYEINGNKLTLTGKFNFTVKDTLSTYIETYKVSIGNKIYLQKQ